jgi:hypothetical protein
LFQYRLYESRHKVTENFGLVAIKKKQNSSQLTSKVFTPNENHPDQEIEEDITTLPQNILLIKLLSPKKTKEEIGLLTSKRHLVSTESPPK